MSPIPSVMRNETHLDLSLHAVEQSAQKLLKRATEGRTPKYASQKYAKMARVRMELGWR